MTTRCVSARGLLPFSALLLPLIVPFAGHESHAQDGRRGVPGGRGGNGVARTLLASPTNPLVAFRFVIRAGSQDDPPGKEGLAALTAAMVAQGGTQWRSYEQVLAAFYPMAATLEPECHKELTVFSSLVHRDSVDAYLDLATEMLTRPRFAPQDFERLRNKALDYVTKFLRGNNDEELGKRALETLLYAGHPYGHPDRGTESGLRAIALADVEAFHRQHYTLEAVSCGIAGGFKTAAVARASAGLAALEPSGTKPPALPDPAQPRGLEVTIIDKPADATAISIGFPIDVTRRDADFYALAVANSYLGEHRTFNGKLMQDLRAKRGLNYGDYSYIEDFIQDGRSTFPVPNNPRRQQYFSIWIRPVPSDKGPFALRAALWELDRLVTRGMTPAQFEATRTFLLNYSKLWLQTLSRRLGYAMDGSFYGCKDLVSEMADRLPKLRVEEVNAAVRRHLAADGMKVAIVARDAAALGDLLKSGQPTPLMYDTEGTPAEILAEDKEIAAFPLKDLTVRIVPVAQMFER
jgi:zinc protease